MNIRGLISAMILSVVVFIISGSGLAGFPNETYANNPNDPGRLNTAPTGSPAYLWQTRQIDNSSAVIGEYPSLVLDNNGHPHIAYTDTTNNRLTYYYEDSAAGYWLRFSTADGEGKYPSLALDELGRTHISYLDGQFLRYTRQGSGGAFEPTEMVTGGVKEAEGSLALANREKPIFSYDSLHGLRISYKGSLYPPYYSHQTVGGSSGNLQSSSIALDRYGYLHISYYDGANADLMYIYQDQSGWHGPVAIDSAGSVGYRPSLALDQYDRPHISYWDWGNGYLKYATRNSSGQWQIDIVDNSGTAGEYNSIAVDVNGRPHIAYYNQPVSFNGDLWYAYKPDYGIWQLELVDSNGDVGIDPSIALFMETTPRIAYFDATNGRLMYAEAQATYSGLYGNIACPWGSRDCNVCVNDVVGSFNSLRSQGDILAYRLGDHPDTGFNGNTQFNKHWQGVQRITAGDGRYLIVTHDDAVDASGEGWSAFAVAHLGSRSSGGERWRSNRIAWGLDFEDTPPPWNDRVVETGWIFDENDYEHPGGIQTLGEFLAVGTNDRVTFWDLAQPNNPVRIPGLIINRTGGRTSSTTSLVQLIDRTFLLAVSDGDARSIDFYPSVSTNLLDGFSTPTYWEPDALIGGGNFFYGWDTFQNLNFATDCRTGKIYLIATSNLDKTANCWPNIFGKPCFPDGQDWASLYEVRRNAGQISLTKVAENRFDCNYPPYGERQCNFDAAAGAYVDPNHQLYLYSTEHTSDGPRNTVKFMEFRPRPHAECSTTSDAWVELFNSRYPGYGWSLMIDWLDRDLENYENFDFVEGFGGVAASVEWCLPQDWTFQLYAPDSSGQSSCGGRMLSFTGNGELQRKILHEAGFENQATCARFVYDPPRVEYYDPALGITIVYYHPSSQMSTTEASPQNSSITVHVPPNAIGETVSINFESVSPPSNDSSPLGAVGHGFNLGAQGGTTPAEELVFAVPAEVTILYEQDEVTGLYENSLALYYWDEPGNAWMDASATCDPQTTPILDTNNNSVQVSVCKTGEYALLGELIPTKVLIDEAHDNLLSLDWARAQQIAATRGWQAEPEWFYLNALKNYLGVEFDLQRYTGPALNAGLLAGFDVLVIPNYEGLLTPAEVSAVRNYVANGGGLILLGDCAFDNHNPELGASYGVKFDPTCLFSPVPDPNGDILVTQLGSHPAVVGLDEITLNWGQSLNLAGLAGRMVATGPDVWQDTNGSGNYEEGEDDTGEFAVGAAYDTGCGRVIALGDNTFSDSDLQWTENEKYMQELLRWVSAGRNCLQAGSALAARILVDESHDNQLSLDWDRAQEIVSNWGGGSTEEAYLGDLKQILSAEFSLERFTGPQLTAAALQGFDAVIIPHYTEALTPAEVEAVKNYVSQGGNLILLGDCGYQLPNPELANAYDLTFKPECLFAPHPHKYGDFVAYNGSTHPAIAGKVDLTMNWGQVLEAREDAAWLLNTASTDSWVDQNGNQSYDAGEEGIFDVAAAFDTGCGRVVAISDAAFSDAHLAYTANDDFLRSALRWLTQERQCTTRVLIDEAHDNYLTLDWDRAQAIVDRQGWGEPEIYVLSTLEESLSDDYSLEHTTSPLAIENLKDYAALIVPWYMDAMSAGEVMAVKQFVKQGGGLILLGDCAFANPNPELAAAYDLEFMPECLFAPLPQHEGDITQFGYASSPPILGDYTSYTQNWGQWLRPNYSNGRVFWLIDTGPANAWRDLNWNEQYEPGEEGVFDVVAGYDTGCGRVAAVADDAINNDALNWTQNDGLLRKLLDWVTAGTTCNGFDVYLPLLTR